MSTKITVKELNQYLNARKAIELVQDRVQARVYYIVETCLSLFGIHDFYIHQVDDSVVHIIRSDTFAVDIELTHSKRQDAHILINGETVNLLDGEFPKRWLWQAFEKEVIAGKEAWSKAALAEMKQEEPENIVEEAKKKLYDFEIEALRKSFLDETAEKPLKLVKKKAAKKTK